MKKKVLALVVLAAMLISILPMAAFAEAADPAANATISKVYTDELTAVADGEEEIELDVYLSGLDATGTPEAAKGDTILYVASTRGEVDTIKIKGTGDSEKESGNLISTTDGWVKIIVTTKVAGTVKLAVGLGGEKEEDTVQNYLDGKDGVTAALAKVFQNSSGSYTTTLTFTASDDVKLAISSTGTKSGEAEDDGNYTYSGRVANGVKYYEVSVVVTSNGTPVAGKEVTFSLNKSGASLTSTKVTSDTKGVAKTKVTATKSAIYSVTAKVGDESVKAYLDFGATEISNVKMVGDNNQKIAKDESNVTLKASFYDGNGNKISLPDGFNASYTAGEGFDEGSVLEGVTLTAVTSPSNAKIETDMNGKYDADGNVASGNDFAFYADNGNLIIKVNKAMLNKEGDYEITLSLINGKSVTYNFNVKEMGDVTGMTLSYDTTSLASGKDDGNVSSEAEVKLTDAEGYTKDADMQDLKFTANNGSLVTVYNADTTVGEEAAEKTYKKGQVLVTSDDTGVVTITAVDTDSKMVATANITIVKAPSALKVTAGTAAAGDEATLTVQLVDVDGQPVSFGVGNATGATAEVVVLSKPADAIVSCDDADVEEDAEKSGKFTMDVLSNVEGEVKVQVILTNTKTGKAYTGSTTVTFGKDSGITGNDIIFMIGASSYVVDGKPVASTSIPFIENGRTYLGIRDMGMAMGIAGDANIVWDQAAQTAKLVKDGITVEVTVGATAIKVTKDNVTTEVAIDAPAQNKDGRVYLPFRAVFEAFGYSVEYANGTITCGK